MDALPTQKRLFFVNTCDSHLVKSLQLENLPPAAADWRASTFHGQRPEFRGRPIVHELDDHSFEPVVPRGCAGLAVPQAGSED